MQLYKGKRVFFLSSVLESEVQDWMSPLTWHLVRAMDDSGNKDYLVNQDQTVVRPKHRLL